ncbi:aspartyl-phosphate phosphatase Spo0E family protein [Clostridium sp. FAM 1755]|nr:aspartyl-phosphate phosphatase Spo0E family protein [Clostridium sporogenes]MDU1421561.1 aspartyl-phosphate phosphatase Spo0E family protein [Clostridium botulinum]HBJ2612329.1 aspartyl-phosphate phosphatase Spo0E family protein [Clostridium botulinum]
MEELRQKLYKFIEQYGLTDTRTIEVSQKLDKLIIKNMSDKLRVV